MLFDPSKYSDVHGTTSCLRTNWMSFVHLDWTSIFPSWWWCFFYSFISTSVFLFFPFSSSSYTVPRLPPSPWPLLLPLPTFSISIHQIRAFSFWPLPLVSLFGVLFSLFLFSLVTEKPFSRSRNGSHHCPRRRHLRRSVTLYISSHSLTDTNCVIHNTWQNQLHMFAKANASFCVLPAFIFFNVQHATFDSLWPLFVYLTHVFTYALSLHAIEPFFTTLHQMLSLLVNLLVGGCLT